MGGPEESRGSTAGILRAFRRLAVIRAVRPDRIASCAQHFIDVAMGAPFAAVTDTDFQALVVKVRAPVAFVLYVLRLCMLSLLCVFFA